jgi:hypothetical protein
MACGCPVPHPYLSHSSPTLKFRFPEGEKEQSVMHFFVIVSKSKRKSVVFSDDFDFGV